MRNGVGAMLPAYGAFVVRGRCVEARARLPAPRADADLTHDPGRSIGSGRKK